MGAYTFRVCYYTCNKMFTKLIEKAFPLEKKRVEDVTGTSRYYYSYINTLSILGSPWGRISIVIHIILFKQDLLLLIPVTKNVIHGRVFSAFRLFPLVCQYFIDLQHPWNVLFI